MQIDNLYIKLTVGDLMSFHRVLTAIIQYKVQDEDLNGKLIIASLADLFQRVNTKTVFPKKETRVFLKPHEIIALCLAWTTRLGTGITETRDRAFMTLIFQNQLYKRCL